MEGHFQGLSSRTKLNAMVIFKARLELRPPHFPKMAVVFAYDIDRPIALPMFTCDHVHYKKRWYRKTQLHSKDMGRLVPMAHNWLYLQ